MTDPERPLGAEPSMESLPPCMLELEPSLASMDSAGHMPPRRLSSTSGAGGEARTAGSGGGWRPRLQVEDSQDLVGMEVDEIKPFDERVRLEAFCARPPRRARMSGLWLVDLS